MLTLFVAETIRGVDWSHHHERLMTMIDEGSNKMYDGAASAVDQVQQYLEVAADSISDAMDPLGLSPMEKVYVVATVSYLCS